MIIEVVPKPGGFETASWKSGQMPAFPCKSKVTVPKTEVLEQPQLLIKEKNQRLTSLLTLCRPSGSGFRSTRSVAPPTLHSTYIFAVLVFVAQAPVLAAKTSHAAGTSLLFPPF
jgi:hypothetical protein